MDRRTFLTAGLAALAAPLLAKAAAPIPAEVFYAVSARGPVSITLPTATPGSTITVLNAGGHALRVYSPASWVRTLSPGQQAIFGCPGEQGAHHGSSRIPG